jgi:hypothetical protein
VDEDEDEEGNDNGNGNGNEDTVFIPSSPQKAFLRLPHF